MIKFRNNTLIREWFKELNRQARRVFIDLEELCAEEGYDVSVSCIYRSDLEQRKIYRNAGKKYVRSPHTYFNAIDATPYRKLTRTKGMPERLGKKIASILNERYPYDYKNIKTVMWHSVIGWHFHIQVNPRNYGNGV